MNAPMAPRRLASSGINGHHDLLLQISGTSRPSLAPRRLHLGTSPSASSRMGFPSDDPYIDFSKEAVASLGTAAPNSTRTLPRDSLADPRGTQGLVTFQGLPTLGTSPNGAPAQDHGLLPPLYSALVQTRAQEAHLDVPVDALVEVAKAGCGTLFVLRPLGSPIMQVGFSGKAMDLHILWEDNSNGGNGSRPSGAFIACVTASGGANSLDVCLPDGEVYGHVLQKQGPPPTYSVVLRSANGEAKQESLLISGDVQAMRLTAAASKDGRVVASAAPAVKKRRNGTSNHLEIRTQRGSDTALILSCFLGLVLFSKM